MESISKTNFAVFEYILHQLGTSLMERMIAFVNACAYAEVCTDPTVFEVSAFKELTRANPSCLLGERVKFFDGLMVKAMVQRGVSTRIVSSHEVLGAFTALKQPLDRSKYRFVKFVNNITSTPEDQHESFFLNSASLDDVVDAANNLVASVKGERLIDFIQTVLANNDTFQATIKNKRRHSRNVDCNDVPLSLKVLEDLPLPNWTFFAKFLLYKIVTLILNGVMNRLIDVASFRGAYNERHTHRTLLEKLFKCDVVMYSLFMGLELKGYLEDE